MEDIDIWRAANQYIKQHGDDALREAIAKQRGALDEEAAILWSRIAAAIQSLQVTNPDRPLN